MDLQDPFGLKDRRLYLVLLAAIFLLGLYAGLEAFPWLFGQKPQDAASSGHTPLPPRGLAVLMGLDREAPDADPLLGTPRPSGGGRLSFRHVMSLLAAKGSDPVARRFARDFLKRADLHKLWTAFEKDEDLPAFAQALRGSTEFTRLMEGYAGEPGFAGLVEEFANLPAVREAMSKGPTLAGIAATGQGPAGHHARGRGAAGPAPAALARPGRLYSGSDSTRMVVSGIETDSKGTPGISERTQDPGMGGAGLRRGPEAHNVKSLSSIPEVGGARPVSAGPWRPAPPTTECRCTVADPPPDLCPQTDPPMPCNPPTPTYVCDPPGCDGGAPQGGDGGDGGTGIVE